MSKVKPHQIAIYTRVSTLQQAADEEGSLKSQRERCLAYLLSSQGVRVSAADVQVFEERGFSAKNTDRPAFQRMQRAIRNGSVRLVLFTELSRVSRSVNDFLRLQAEWAGRGAKFVSLRENFDCTTSQGRMLMTIFMALYEFERETTSERTRLNMHARALRGLYNGGGKLLGYDPDPDRKGHLIINEGEAAIVRSVFEFYLDTGSVPETVKGLAAAGIKRPAYESSRGKKHPAQKILWDGVRGILGNPSYVGLKEVNRKNRKLSGEAMAALLEKERYQTVPAVWDAIVPDITFERAQELLRANDETNHNSVRRRHHDFILTKLVRCPGCGHSLQGATAKYGQFAYYQHRPGTYKDGLCPQRRWSAAPLETAAVDRLYKLADDEALLGEVIERANQRVHLDSPLLEAELSEARRMEVAVQAEADTLIAKIIASKAEAPDFVRLGADRKQKDLDAARRRVVHLERKLEELRLSRLEVAAYRTALKDFEATFATMDRHMKSTLMRYFIDRIEQEDQEVRIWMRGDNPDREEEPTRNWRRVNGGPGKKEPPTEEFSVGGEWLPLADSNCGPSD